MKIKAKQYARALYESCAGKSEKELKSSLKDFVSVLVRNNDLSKVNSITTEFAKIWNREKGIVEAQVTGARELDKEMIKTIKNYLDKTVNAKEVIIKENIDNTILGGVILKYGDKILDASVKSKLNQLKNNLKK